jgi:tetratricopeptide (TPR) repeat protein
MDLFTIDFFDDNVTFSDEEFSELMEQANAVIRDEKETSQRRAGACVIKFQLLTTRNKLDPKLLEKALELYPDMPQALTGMGCFYLHIYKEDKALACFDKAIEADPLFPYSWLQKAYLEEKKEEKLRLLDEFTKRNPDSIRGFKEKEAILYDQLHDQLDIFNGFEDIANPFKNKNLKHIKKDIQRQIDNYSELIRLDPTHKDYYENRAKLYIYISKIDFMLSDDGDKFPSVDYNAVKDIEKWMSLESDLEYFMAISHSMLNLLPIETHKKYIEQLIADLPPGMDKVSAEYKKRLEWKEKEAILIGRDLSGGGCDVSRPKFEIISEV